MDKKYNGNKFTTEKLTDIIDNYLLTNIKFAVFIDMNKNNYNKNIKQLCINLIFFE